MAQKKQEPIKIQVSPETESIVKTSEVQEDSKPIVAEEFEVETVGNIGLVDPVTNMHISHNKPTLVKNNPFVMKMLKMKRIRKV